MPEPGGELRFGPFALDGARGDLRRDGDPVEIQATPLRLLRYLVEHPGVVIPRDELLDHVWDGVAVSEGVISTALKQVRRVLDDREREPPWIETLRGRGIRWNAPVERIAVDLSAADAVGRTPVLPRHESPFVGRERELARLHDALEAAVHGSARVVLLDGEAGIGKTRTAQQCVEEARALGFGVHESWCYEGAGAPAYQPWIQLVRSVARERGAGALAATLGEGAADVARLVPELQVQLPDLPELAVARSGGDAQRALERARRAADAARANLAWEEEARQLQHALAAVDLGALASDGEHCALWLQLAEAQLRVGSIESARQTALRAAKRAEGDPTTCAAVARVLASDEWKELGELPELRRPISGERVALAALRAVPAPNATGRCEVVVAACVAALALLASAVWWSWPAPLGLVSDLAGLGSTAGDAALPDKPSIAVLPFANLSGDAEQGYLSDGITEDLTTDLSRNPTLFVVARNSALAYGGKAVDVRQVGRELGVRYVLEGSVRREADRVRITAQLVDATTGMHLWSQRYDRELSDILGLQAEIAERIQVSLRSEIQAAELTAASRQGTDDLRAYDAYLQALSHVLRLRRDDVVEDGRRLAARAIEFDPNFAQAHALVGQSYSLEYGLGWSDDPTLLERAEASAQRALEIDPASANAFAVLSTVAYWRGQPEEALAAADRAVEAAPNRLSPHLARVPPLTRMGRIPEAVESLQRVIRLDPRGNPGMPAVVAWVNFAAGRREEAALLFEQTRRANPDAVPPRVMLAAYYESEGRHEEAQALVAEIQGIVPDFTAESGARFVAATPLENGRELLRRAGLPDAEIQPAHRTALRR